MNETQRPGRNDPCPCGSGKKFKKCHGLLPESEIQSVLQKTPDLSKPLPMMNQMRMPLLNAEERESMRAACRFNASLMDHLRPKILPGITTQQIDDWVHEYTLDHGHRPATLGYKGFPKSCCTSINEVVCHGIPGNEVLNDGDIINVDITSIVDGWYGDQSETFLIGEVSPETRQLVQVTFDCLHAGIDAIGPDSSVREIGVAIVETARPYRFGVVKEYQGHGLGRKFHQAPDVPHYPDTRIRYDNLPVGVCFTIEPMINLGTWKTDLDRSDGWTVRTKDRKLSAQFEHTLLMTDEGPEILTVTQDGPQKGHRF